MVVTVTKAGELVAEGALVEEPSTTVSFVRSFLADHGATLGAGTRIIAGSVVAPVAVVAGDGLSVSFGPLGHLGVVSAPRRSEPGRPGLVRLAAMAVPYDVAAMPEEIEVLTGRARAAAGIVIALIVAFGIFLRFFTHSALWLDEALTVNRSSLPVRDIAASLKQDGAPPLYYYLLHYWMDVFGQSDLATRSLSGVIGVATLPVAWLAANRFGGRIAAWVTLVLLAERALCRVLLHRGAHVLPRDPAHGMRLPRLDPGPGAAPSGQPHCHRRRDGGAALHPVLVSVPRGDGRSLAARLGLVDRPAARRSEQRSEGSHPVPAFFAVAVGCLLFVPWLPTFFYQSQHTGTPWAKPPNFGAIVSAVTAFADNQGSLAVGTTQGRLLAVIYLVMFALAIFGVGRSRYRIDLDLHTRPRRAGWRSPCSAHSPSPSREGS